METLPPGAFGLPRFERVRQWVWQRHCSGDYEYWVYRHCASLEPREQHLAWDGLILPPDHPFWATHAPPNGWGCSCCVLGARSMAIAKTLGGKPGLTLPANWQALAPKTGVPFGIDKGWAYAPGQVRPPPWRRWPGRWSLAL